LDPKPAAQTVGIVFKNYARSGDQMTLSFDTATKKVGALYAGRIREGYRPHPRHWRALTELTGFSAVRE
jgi:hypothetical protein